MKTAGIFEPGIVREVEVSDGRVECQSGSN